MTTTPQTNKPAEKKTKLKIKQLVKYVAVGCVAVVGIGIGSSVIVFLNLDHFKHRIQRIVAKETGFKLDYNRLTTGFTWYAEPYIKIDNLSLTNPQIKNQFFQLKQLYLSLSWASIWQQLPIFDNVVIVGSKIALEYDQNDNLLLNKQPLINLAQPTTLDFDVTKYLLQQHSLTVGQIDLSLIDSKHKILPLSIDDINLTLRHNLEFANELALEAKLVHSTIKAKLGFNGNSITNFRSWSDGLLTINSVGKRGYLVNINALVKDYELEHITANIDSNRNVFNSYSKDYGRLNDFSGQAKFVRTSFNNYQLTATNMTLSTEYGYLLHNANINGHVKLGHGGYFDINNLSLAGFNSLLQYKQAEQKIKFDGDISAVHLKWDGKLLNPQHLTLSTHFKNITLKSDESNIPSFNNLSGTISTEKDHGQIALSMKNSEIKLPQYLRQPLLVNNMDAIIAWKLESNNNAQLNWQKAIFKTPELNLTSDGNYSLGNHLLQSNTIIKNINLAGIYKYLPVSIKKNTVDDLQKNLTGQINDLTIKIKGNPESIPFTKNDGDLLITGKINNANYIYDKELPSLNNVYGLLQIHNQKLTFKTTSAAIGELAINAGIATIPDITKENSIASASGEINTDSNEFIDFMANSPFKNEASELQNTVIINGQSKVGVKLSLPLNKPEKMTINGQLSVYNNDIRLKENESVSINDFNGTMNFSQTGMNDGKFTALLFNSPLEIKLPNSHHLEVVAPEFNYSNLISAFNPHLTEIIHGTATTKLDYDLDNQQVQLSSSLEHVALNLPQPLFKAESTIAPLNIDINLKEQANLINVNYNDTLFNTTQLSTTGKILSLKTAIGTSNLELNNNEANSPVSLKVQLNKTKIDEWLGFISRLNNILSNTNESSESSMTIATPAMAAESEGLIPYPISVEWDSNAFWYNNYNFDYGTFSATIYPRLILGVIKTPDVSGRIGYSSTLNHFSVDLDRVLFNTNNFLESIPNNTESQEEVYSLNESAESAIIIQNDESHVTNTLATFSNLHSESGINTINALTDSTSSINESSPAGESGIEVAEEVPRKRLNLPNADIIIKNLYFQDYYLGRFRANLLFQNDDLYVDNATLSNKSAYTKINFVDHCVGCQESAGEYVAVNIHSDIRDLGKTVQKLGQGDMFKKGNGSADVSLMWLGGIESFNPYHTIAYANLDIANGIVNVKPGLFGALLGVINLSALNITNLNHFNFNSLFGQNFVYNKMDSNLYLENGNLHIEKLNLTGDIAEVSTFGNYYLESQTIDTYLTVQPQIGGTVATTAGIVTLNPIIGGLVYLAQKIIGDPISKALAISYHVHGDVSSPTMTQIKVSKQIMENFKSSMSILPKQENE